MGKKTRASIIFVITLFLLYLSYWTFILPFVEQTSKDIYTKSYVYNHSVGICLVMLISLVSNTILFLTIYLSTHIRGKIHYFVISMIISDVLLTMTTMPLEVYDDVVRSNLHQITDPSSLRTALETQIIIVKASQFFSVFTNVSYCTNFAMLCLIRLWRCLFCHRADVSLRLSAFLLSASWMYAVTVVVIHLLQLQVYWLEYSLEFFIPMTVAGVIFWFAFYTQRNISNLDGEENNINATAVLVLLVSALVLRAPYFVVLLLDNYPLFEAPLTLARVKGVALHLFYLRSCTNMAMLGCLDTSYRESLAEMLRRFQRCCLCYNNGVQISFKPSTEDVQIVGVDDDEYLIDTPSFTSR